MNALVKSPLIALVPIALVLIVLVLMLVSSAVAQPPAEWHDDLVDHMAGHWKLIGQVMGRDAHHEVQADWQLNHQFLRIKEETAADAPPAEHKYEAIWFLGYDPVSERYVLHLLDVFGTRYSETLGFGTRDGNAIRFCLRVSGRSVPHHISLVS